MIINIANEILFTGMRISRERANGRVRKSNLHLREPVNRGVEIVTFENGRLVTS